MKHKDHYDDEYVAALSEKIRAVESAFDHMAFQQDLKGQLEHKELFSRFDVMVDAMKNRLDRSYPATIEVFTKLLGPELQKPEGMFQLGWWLWPIGRYVERYGNEDWRLSLSYLKELTKRFTGEYAIRPLLKEHPKEVMKELLLWTTDENVHVRRLASEGVRIYLPWSPKLLVALDEFEVYARLLTNLKDDPERFVQKSVGNNLNDLYKIAPEKAEDLIAQWRKTEPSKAQDWIIKHGMRRQTR